MSNKYNWFGRVIRKRWMTLFPLLSFAALATGFFLFPGTGFWGVDAGVKTLAAAYISQQEQQNYTLPETGGEIDPDGYLRPYGPPFAVERNDRWITVYSPLFLLLASFGWWIGGETAIRIISLVGTLLAMIVILKMAKALLEQDSNHQPTLEDRSCEGMARAIPVMAVIATPMLFYSYAIWEHTLFTAVALAALWIRFFRRGELSGVLAGIVAATGVAFRPEGLIWAIILIAAGRKGLFGYLGGLVTGLLAVAGLQAWMNGEILPLQWTANLGFFQQGLPGIANRIIVLLGRSDFGFGWIWLTVLLVLPVLVFRTARNTSRLFIVLTLILYSGLWLYRVIDPAPLGLLARSSGWLATAPLAAAWWMLPCRDRKTRMMMTAVAGFVMAAVVSNPVPDGIHHGPRVLLPAMVMGTLGALTAAVNLDRWKRLFILGLFIISSLNQVSSLVPLWQQRADNGRMRGAVSELVTDEPLLISGWHLGADLGPESIGRTVLMPGTERGWTGVLKIMRAGNVRSFWHLKMKGIEDPGQITGPGVEPAGESYRGRGWKLERYLLVESGSSSSTPRFFSTLSADDDRG